MKLVCSQNCLTEIIYQALHAEKNILWNNTSDLNKLFSFEWGILEPHKSLPLLRLWFFSLLQKTENTNTMTTHVYCNDIFIFESY